MCLQAHKDITRLSTVVLKELDTTKRALAEKVAKMSELVRCSCWHAASFVSIFNFVCFVQEKQYMELQIAHADLQNAKRTLHVEKGRETAQGRRDVSVDEDAELVDQYMPIVPLPSLYSV